MEEVRIENTIENDAQDTVTLAAPEEEVAQKRSPEEQERIRNRRKQAIVRQLKPLLFIGPNLIFFCMFVIFPFFYGIYISFFQWNIMGGEATGTFVGIDNFKQIFTFVVEGGYRGVYSEYFFDGLAHTCLYTVVMVPLLICAPLAFAVMIGSIKNKILQRIFQAIMYASSLLSVATVVIIWKFLGDQQSGLFFQLGVYFDYGVQPYAWIFIFALTIWSGIGGNMVIFMAGLSNIPTTYYEAAEIDGANALVKFWKITLPSMRFQLLYTTVMGTIGAFNVYGQPALFGGTDTDTVMVNIKECLDNGSAGMASAMALLLGIIISGFSGLQFKMMAKGD